MFKLSKLACYLTIILCFLTFAGCGKDNYEVVNHDEINYTAADNKVSNTPTPTSIIEENITESTPTPTQAAEESNDPVDNNTSNLSYDAWDAFLDDYILDLEYYGIDYAELGLFIEDFYNGDIALFHKICKEEGLEDALVIYAVWQELYGYSTSDLLESSINQIPSYETEYTTIYVENFFGDYESYTKYTSYDILYDIENTRGILSSGSKGLWYQVFYLMRYGSESVPEVVDCWKNEYGRIAFILPNGMIYMDDCCYAVLIANNIEDEDLRNAFFYDNVNADYLGSYLANYGPPDVQLFLTQWYGLEEKKQAATDKWIDSWNYGPNY